eukprot:SAG22_NODE_26_length_29806_cov_19.885381_3_plen_78_part_00
MDKKTINFIMISAASFLGTAIPFIIALMPPYVPPDEDGDSACTLGSQGMEAFQMTASLVNSSCTFNLTVGPGGVVVW